jgi:hypothetical protein
MTSLPIPRIALSGAIAFALFTVPLTASAQIAMSDLWPNENGLRWEYRQTLEMPETDPVQTTVALRFDGTAGLPGELEVQNLVEELPAATASLAAAEMSDPLMRNLWALRPDLRPELESRGFASPQPTAAAWESLFLHGGLWEKTESEIRIWRTEPSFQKGWLYLVSDLSLGNSFQLQLVPELASDVYLTGTVSETGVDVSVPAGDFYGVYRIDYEVDYGESICTSPDSPDVTGTFRVFTRGYVHYSPGIGPIQSLEELTYSDPVGSCPDIVPDVVVSRVRMELLEIPLPVLPTTWGRLKARY